MHKNNYNSSATAGMADRSYEADLNLKP